MTDTLRIATRRSTLAMWQAGFVRNALLSAHPGLRIEISGFTTEGDRNKHSPLRQIGGKGLFVKELEEALLTGEADIAVHSMKDVPGELPAGLIIGAICEREDPRDALISNDGCGLLDLPDRSIIGTSSLRRRFQLAEHLPALDYRDLRGNVDTRLQKLDAGEYDGIILAAAGLRRLGLAQRITELIDVRQCLPAAGQGALGIECRDGDSKTMSLINVLNHSESVQCVNCERAVTVTLEATCNLPIAAFAEINGDQISLQTFVSDNTGNRIIRQSGTGPRKDSMAMARIIAGNLLADGAADIIKKAGQL